MLKIFTSIIVLTQRIPVTTKANTKFYDFDECESEQNELGGRKFMTFFSSLLLLLKFCVICGLPAVIQKVHTKGTALSVKLFLLLVFSAKSK